MRKSTVSLIIALTLASLPALIRVHIESKQSAIERMAARAIAQSILHASSPIVDIVDAFEFPNQYECPNMSTPTECGQTRFFYLGYTAAQFCYWHGFGGASTDLWYGGTVAMGFGDWYQVWAGAICEEF